MAPSHVKGPDLKRFMVRVVPGAARYRYSMHTTTIEQQQQQQQHWWSTTQMS